MDRQSLMVPTGRLRAVSMVLAAVVLVGAAASSAFLWSTALPRDVAVRVGDQDITIAELQRRVDVLSAIYGVTAPEKGKPLRDFQRASAKSIAISTVLEQAAADRDILVANKTLQDQLSKIIAEQNGDRSSFVRFLGEKGLREADVIDELRRATSTQRLFHEVTAGVPKATKADAKREYATRRAQMRTPELRRLANIVVATEAEAGEVVQRLRDGAGFADVASSTSLDSSTSQKGGDLGQDVPQSSLEPAYGKAAFAARRAEIFGPVRTESGWNVGTVLDVQPGEQLSYDDVESTLLAAITSRRQQAAWTAWLNDRIAASDVEYADKFRPARLTVESGETTGVNR